MHLLDRPVVVTRNHARDDQLFLEPFAVFNGAPFGCPISRRSRSDNGERGAGETFRPARMI